jgi:hypothetical protein
MSATMTTAVKGAEEGGSFLTRLAWYYQMGFLLVLAALLFWGADLMLSARRPKPQSFMSKSNSSKVKNAQASIIRQNLAATEQTLLEKRRRWIGSRSAAGFGRDISRIRQHQRLSARAATGTEAVHTSEVRSG